MYGFKLGQIEGLDPSVQTVTATIADQSTTNTYTLSYNEINTDWEGEGAKLYDLGSSQGYALEVSTFEESDVGDTHNVTISTSAVEENFKSAVETVLVDNGLISEPETLFDGTITITDGAAEIPFDGDVSSYPFEKWTVTVNDEPLEYNGEVFRNETETHMYVVGNKNGVYKFSARDADDVIPGDYQVKITGVSKSGGESNITYFKFSTISELPAFEQVQRLVNGGHAFMFLRGVSEPPIQFDFNDFDNPFYKISYFNAASLNATIDMYTVYADGRRIEQTYNTNLTLTPVSG